MRNLIFIWKKCARYNLICCSLLLLTLFFLQPAYSQKIIECGQPKLDLDAMNKAEAYQFTKGNKFAAPAPVLMRVYFHICRNDDGSNAGATEAVIQSEFDQLLADYGPDNICFANMGINYINNTKINTNLHVDNPQEKALLSPYLFSNCINIFYHAALYNSNGAIGGASYNIPNTFCSVIRNKIGTRAVSHETGHCFGLFHTHQSCGSTYIDGTNCSTTGDRVCDTPADPICFFENSDACFSNTGCTYTGTCVDAENATNWSPPYNNIMSYWSNMGACKKTNLTNGQYARVNSYLSTDPGLQYCSSVSDATVSNININGKYMASAINTLVTNGSVVITGTATVGLAARTVVLNPGFHANPTANGIVLVRTTSCNFSSANRIANTNSGDVEKSKVTNKKPEPANAPSPLTLSAYPNPAYSEVHLAFNLTSNEKNILLQIYDMNAKKIQEQTFNYLPAGKQNISVNLRNLASGVYYVSLQLSTGRLTTKILINK
jgi:hypothetical protein